ncbi:unnamed protein product, partial [Symbiodinium necroappetens]
DGLQRPGDRGAFRCPHRGSSFQGAEWGLPLRLRRCECLKAHQVHMQSPKGQRRWRRHGWRLPLDEKLADLRQLLLQPLQ